LENARLIGALESAKTKRFATRDLERAINNASSLKRSFAIEGYASSMILRVQAGHIFGIIAIECDKRSFTELSLSVFL